MVEKTDKYKISYFLGANTPQGFVSYFGELTDINKYKNAFIIKGGPGTGKSTLMKKIAEKAEKNGGKVEYIFCSSDPESLDAVIIHQNKSIIADGTPPHIIEPKYPGAFEKIININQIFDNAYLEANKSEIIKLLDQNKVFHQRTSIYLAAAGALRSDNQRIIKQYINFNKIIRYAENFIKKTKIPHLNMDKYGGENKRFLSAVSCKGFLFFDETIKKQCDLIVNINDEYGVCSAELLESLKQLYLKYGLDVYSCYCSLSPNQQLEHLIIPQLRIAFTTKNKYHSINNIPSSIEVKNISHERFCDMKAISEYKKRMKFNKKACEEMLKQAIEIQKSAKENHDNIEKLYLKAIDFENNKEFFNDAFEIVTKGL